MKIHTVMIHLVLMSHYMLEYVDCSDMIPLDPSAHSYVVVEVPL